MSQQQQAHVSPLPLKNVAGFMKLTQILLDRGPHQPGLGVCHGPSGYGKTVASIFAQNKTDAIRVECMTTWRPKSLLQAILRECRVEFGPRTPVAELEGMVIAALGEQPDRPLIIDEADKLVENNLAEIAREVQEGSGAPVLLIGEEKLPLKLSRIEKVHNRVLHWFAAQPCDLDDARALADAFAPKLKIADDLLDLIRQQSDGRARRIVTNVAQVGDFARNKALKTVDLGAWAGRPLYTGAPPVARPIDEYKPAARRAAA